MGMMDTIFGSPVAEPIKPWVPSENKVFVWKRAIIEKDGQKFSRDLHVVYMGTMNRHERRKKAAQNRAVK